MKKLLLFVLLLVSYQTMAQTLSSALNAKFYVQGIAVTDTIFLNEYYVGVDKVNFYVLNAKNDTIKQSLDTDSTDGFSWILDMSQLTPDSKIEAQMFISETKEGDPINDFIFTVIPKPEWLKNGSLNNLSVDGYILSFEGKYPIQSYEYIIPKKIKLIGNKPLSIVGDFIFKVEYNLNTGEPKVQNNNSEIILNLLNQKTITKTMDFDSNCELGKDLNLSLVFNKDISDSVSFRSPKIKFPIPGVPFAKLKFDAGLKLIASLKGDLVIGEQGGQFGFIELNGKKTKLVGVLTGIGDIKGELDAVIGSVDASLFVKARFGVGFDYVNIPSSSFNPLIGGDLDVYGEICGSIFGSKKKCKLSDSFYYIDFGDTSAVRGDKFDNIFNVKSSTKRGIGTSELPAFKPFPTFANRNDELYSVWLEYKNESTQLLFSQLNKSGSAFENTLVVTEAGIITNPKIGILPNGSALITWTQNKYDQTNTPSGISDEDFVKGQNIWVAFYDKEQNEIIYKNQLGEDGFADGQANISVGKNNEAIITWLSKNFVDEQSDVMFSKLSENDSSWNISAPVKINTINGLNSQVNVVYTDSIHAIAVWINDPDADDETIDNNIVFSEWDGQSWSTQTQQLTDNNGYYNYKNVTLAVNKNKVALGYTGTEYFDNDLFENQLNLHVYDSDKDDWDTLHSFTDSDSLYYFQNPQVSISETGMASLAYQVIEMFPNSQKSDNGELYLYIKDLNKSDSEWNEITGNTNLCDTNTFIWDMTAGFGHDNQYYVMTQEYSDDGIVKNPHSGVLFGDPELSMVLRGLKVNNDLTISDIEEPDTKTTRLQNVEAPKFRYNNNYPNPFERFTTIEFSLYTSAHVTLEIFNYTGTKVATLIDSQMAQGIYKTNFDAGDLPGGIYYSKLTVDGNASTGKMIIMK